MNWIAKEDTIIFAPEFNSELDISLVSNYAKLIFSNYEFDDNELNDELFKLITKNYDYDYDCYYNDKYFSGTCIENKTIHRYEYSKFNKSVNNLPTSLTHLTFGCSFDKEVNVLPESITHLTFGEKFNQEANKLPASLTHLTFGYYFNQEVNVLPKNLTHLTFGYYFNQEVNVLPKKPDTINFE